MSEFDDFRECPLAAEFRTCYIESAGRDSPAADSPFCEND